MILRILVKCKEKDNNFASIGAIVLRGILAFLCNHVAGEPKTDNAENSEAIFLDCSEVLEHPEVTDTAKALLQIALDSKALPMQDARKGRVMFSTGDIV